MREEKSRIWLLSNMKAVLILLVVFGHYLPHLDGLGRLRYELRTLIWMFHMPAFLFVSGFLSKNFEKCRNTAVAAKLVPYVMLVLIIGVSRWFFLGEPFRISLVNPALSTWYFLVLFWYALFVPDLVKLRGGYAAVVVLALLMGCYTPVGSAYAMGKTFAFLPFYLAGVFCTPEILMKLKDLPKWLSLPALAGSVGTAWWFTRQDVDAVLMFSMRDSYAKLGLGDLQGVLYRLLGYIGAFLMIFVLILLSSKKKTFFSYIGDNTLAVYSFHLVMIYLFRYLGLMWNTKSVGGQLAQALAASVLITAVLGIPIFSKVYAAFLNAVYRLFTKTEKET